MIAATEREVVVLYHQRGLSPSGERFDGEVLGLYEIRDGKFARAQMFDFDAIAVQRFLAAAEAAAVLDRRQRPRRTDMEALHS